jgi:hypothetical protein
MPMPPIGMPQMQAPKMDLKGPQASMQGMNFQAQGPQAHMQGPQMQAPPPPAPPPMQFPAIKMEAPKPPAEIKTPGMNMLLIVIICLVAFLLGAILMVLLIKPK